MPKSPKKPIRRDRGFGEQELEDRVGRRPDEKPDMVPPGTTVGRPGEDEDETRERPDDPDEDRGHEEALEADRATARRSDGADARDGVDPSDSVPQDPDGLGGGAKRRRS